MAASRKKKRLSPRQWTRLSKDQLLDTRICDIEIDLNIDFIQNRIAQLYREMESRDMVFRPHFWLSDEWFVLDGVPGVAIPFFLSHPKLRRLEKEFMMEVEGGDARWCMKLLRHETGHAVFNAYKLGENRQWRRVFGNPNSAYPDTYLPKPYSKRFVINLPNWYAQSHPHEDWAETFAVWLNPKSAWRRRYRNWPALKKLEFVDNLMQELAASKPRITNKREVYPASKIRKTLRQYYEEKSARYGTDSPQFFDRDLTKIFVAGADAKHHERASRYIRRARADIIETVERWTNEYRYRINEVLNDMIRRCDKLDLRVTRNDNELLPDMTACLTMLVMSKLHSNGFHIAL